MRILFIVPELDRPSTVNRVILFVPYLESQGAQVEVAAFPRKNRDRLDLLDRATEFDIVVLQKRLLRRGYFRRLRRQARRLVFDFDDAILFRDSTKGRPNSLTRRSRFRRIVEGCDTLWASNAYLAELAKKFARDPKRIEILPTVVDLREWQPRVYRQTGRNDPVILGWMGGEKNLLYLEDVREALETVGKERPQATLRILSRRFPDYGSLKVEYVPWTRENEVQYVQSFDVGLAPLRDDHWSRGKNTLKILNYFGAALPVVASPVGINAEIVVNGETGFIANSCDEWVEALLYLIDHPEERKRMGFAGRKRVAEKFSLEAVAPKMWESLQRLMGGCSHPEA